MKKEKAIPIMKRTGRAEGSQKELNKKTNPGELKESQTPLLVKVW
jgi:hypothetical protein